MTEDSFRTILREELEPIKEKLDIHGNRLNVLSQNQELMLRILRGMARQRSGGSRPEPVEAAAKGSD